MRMDGRIMTVCVALMGVAGACSAESDSSSRGSGGANGRAAMSDPFGNASPGSNAFGNPQGTPSGVAGAVPATATTCAQGTANASPVTPTVWLVVDGSGSMDESFGSGSTRWEALRSALMDPGGVVADLERVARFGLVIYNGPENGQSQCNTPDRINILCACFTGFEPECCEPACGGTPPPAPTDPSQCANLVVVDPALDNYATIDAAYPAQELGGWTPTDRAIQHVVTNLPVTNAQQLDTDVDPVYVVLATDGAPNDHCGTDGGGGGGSGFDPVVAQRVVDEVTRGVQMGMRLFVISLAGNDAELQRHLEQVAQIGGTGQPPFVPATKGDLVAVLQQIIGGATCQVTLDGSVQSGQECAGEVTLNGFALDCNAPDGWRMHDERTVQLTGSACDMFLGAPSQVHATFPCGIFTPD